MYVPYWQILFGVILESSQTALCTYHRPSPGGGPWANTTIYGDFMEDLNDYFTQEVREMGEVWFPKALHHGENRGLCTLRVTSLCNSFANIFNLLFVCKFLKCDDLIVENLLDSNSHQYCYKHSMNVQANVAEVQPEEERSWEGG